VARSHGNEAGGPDLGRLRLCVENKSVVTAHRNRTNRYDDLSDVVGVLHQKKADAILAATILVVSLRKSSMCLICEALRAP